jgi:hypothetical protein
MLQVDAASVNRKPAGHQGQHIIVCVVFSELCEGAGFFSKVAGRVSADHLAAASPRLVGS